MGTRLSFGSMVQKGKFSAAAWLFVRTLKNVDFLKSQKKWIEISDENMDHWHFVMHNKQKNYCYIYRDSSCVQNCKKYVPYSMNKIPTTRVSCIASLYFLHTVLWILMNLMHTLLVNLFCILYSMEGGKVGHSPTLLPFKNNCPFYSRMMSFS